MPKVSMLMCIYNGETYLRPAIESILEQTYQDFELILVNDGSQDSTSKFIDEYAARDSRIIVVNNDVNLGLEKSLNKGLSVVTGDYFARQDADDISLPNRLEKQIQFLENHPEVGAIGTAVDIINGDGKSVGGNYLPTEHHQLKALLLLNNFIHHSTLMARTSVMHQIGGYREDLRYVEDYDLWWKISEVSELACLPDIYLQRRMDDGPRVSLLNRERQLENAHTLSLKFVQDSWQNAASPLDEEAFRRFWWTCLRVLDRNSYQKLWVEQQNNNARLSRKDVKKLAPLWTFFQNFPGATDVWGPHIQKTAYDLMYRDYSLAGLHLWWVATKVLKTPLIHSA